MTRLAITMLGRLEFRLTGDVAPKLPVRKSKALLVYLALSPGMTRSREHLAGALWDRSAEEQARASLRQTLSTLRKALSHESTPIIGADSDMVWLEPKHIETDVLQFEGLAADGQIESLEQAAALYRGDLLAGFSLRESSFEEWMAAERRRYRELAVQVFSDLLIQLARGSQTERAIQVAERLLTIDPLQEWTHCALMRLYRNAGRREAALKQYQECVRILDREFSIAPARETQQLAREIGGESVTEATPEANGPDTSTEATLAMPEPPEAAAGELPRPALPAERKDLSVLRATLRQSFDDPDPEASADYVDPLLKTMVTVVQRFGGTVSQVRGDGITALFGAPHAYEDHAVRACYAALAMRDAVASMTGENSHLTIGLDSGEAVVRTIGDERSRHFDAVGLVSRTADQCEAGLEPGQIALTAHTYRRAEGFVEVQPLGARSVEDAPEPIELYSLGARSHLRSRWEARASRELTGFVGRDREMAHLSELLERTKGEAGQVAAIAGDPGVGKSRLVHEFVNSPFVSGWTVLATGAMPHDTGAVYLPFANLLRAWLAIGQHDTRTEARSKLEEGLNDLDADAAATIAPLAAMLDLPVDDTSWTTLSPPQKRWHTLEAIKAVLVRLSEVRPLIVVLEDLHWIDTGSQAVLDHLVETLGTARVLLLLTHRPEYQHDWFAKTYFCHLRLEPLGAENADRLLRTLLGDDPALSPLRSELIQRTGGTPLFLEESIRVLAENGFLTGAPGAYRLVRPVAEFEVPSTVQAVLAARIDRLPAASKNLLQAAAVIGTDVPIEILKQITDIEEEPLRESLLELQRAELIYETRVLPSAEYAFKHALTHQVAYQSMLAKRRRELHVRVVDAIENLYEDRIDEYVERLAHHTLEGGLWRKAVDYLYRSANKAMQRSAHQDAIAHLNRGLEIVDKLPDSRELLTLELDYQKTLGVACMAARGWAAREVLDAYTRARVLCEELDDKRELFIVLRGEGQYRMIRGESDIARELGDRCVELAKGMDDIGVHIETHHLFWTNSFFMGDYASVGEHCNRGIELYDPERDHGLTYVYSGHDPGVCCRIFTGLIECLCGYPDQALGNCTDGLALSERLQHPLTTALVYWAYSYVHLFRHEPHEARKWAEKEIAICEEYLLPLLRSHGMFQRGWALAQLGETREGIDCMREGLAGNSRTGAEMGSPYFTALLGEALGRAGDPAGGLDELNTALETAGRTGARFQYSEMMRLKGDLLMMRSGSDDPEAEEYFRRSIETADAQHARLPRLRSATALARLLERRGARHDALAVLRPHYEAMTEGFNTADVAGARILLESLMDDA